VAVLSIGNLPSSAGNPKRPREFTAHLDPYSIPEEDDEESEQPSPKKKRRTGSVKKRVMEPRELEVPSPKPKRKTKRNKKKSKVKRRLPVPGDELVATSERLSDPDASDVEDEPRELSQDPISQVSDDSPTPVPRFPKYGVLITPRKHGIDITFDPSHYRMPILKSPSPRTRRSIQKGELYRDGFTAAEAQPIGKHIPVRKVSVSNWCMFLVYIM